MSVATLTSVTNAYAAQAAGGAQGEQKLPPSFTDQQGRVFNLQRDPVDGSPQYLHKSRQTDPQGGSLDLEILIDLGHPDAEDVRSKLDAVG